MRILRRLIRDEEGSATIEGLLWLPLFVGLMGITVDVSMVFNAHARIKGVLEDVDRAYSVGRLESTAQVEERVAALLAHYGDTVTVSTTEVDGIIGTTVTVPMSKLVATKFLPKILDMTLTVQDYRYKEA
ncbi:MAG: hypothetical protein EP320_09715 [Rhodobacteraceae bacterium]|jgi:Flp pilus assembly protein TadG|uniref:TadE-like protein n=2 Tax=Thioclava marina TaxID=1915077 RepID=A0ABX3MLS4_9RHOB|nr:MULTISPECIES: hypothetical protein [Thioclava]TNE87708.1 MAG: hypothetical protein EP337_10645 [Paracoccaceae bacterium]MBD3805118.1 hypothetical protein [Thioclava sp.]OOY12505.1 hypothetical protein BMG00_01215 [Thioclava marina]OOY28526.1 hypothetical protein BMI90_07610 [Thioclava sp. L04-15]TNF13286.1 MAG: hypothetical protein EP320_09715 [Paracoccaceae bacterium]